MKLLMNCLSKNPLKFQTPVSPELVRGRAVTNPYYLYKMKQSGINQIIDLRNSAFIKSGIEKFFCKILNIKYVHCKYPHRINYLPDREFFDNIIKKITQNNGKTYIHCQYGKRRTGIAVAIYEKQHLKKSKQEVMLELFNLGFKELVSSKKFSKRNKYNAIITDFIKRYYPDEC